MLQTAIRAAVFAAVLAGAPFGAAAGRVMGNALDAATSPYLQTHRDDPVHWQEWSATTLESARQSGGPIFLSIGYSACHW